MHRDASHLWHSFSHNRTKINIQFLNDVSYLVLFDSIYSNLPAKLLLEIQTVQVFVKIISIPDKELFSEKSVGGTTSYFVKSIPCSTFSTFVTPVPQFEAVYCFIRSRQRVAVARNRIICLVLVLVNLFRNASKYSPKTTCLGIALVWDLHAFKWSQ